jgi:hypothetical protein
MTEDPSRKLKALQNQINTLITAQIITMRIVYRLVRSLDTAAHTDCVKLADMGKALRDLQISINKYQ